MRNDNGSTRSRTHWIAWAIVTSISVAWVFAVYVAYYTVHKPVSLPMVLAIADRAIDLIVCAALLLIATALGHRLLGRLNFHSTVEELSLTTGSGLGFVSLLVLGLGLVGGLRRWVFYLGALVVCVVLLPDLKATFGLLRKLKRPSLRTTLHKLLVGYLLVVLCISALVCLTPPVAWDSQVYHLAGPKLFIEQGRITGEIDIPYLGFPALLEMLFLAGMAVKGDIVAKLVHFAYTILTVGLLYCFATRHLQARMPWLASAIFVSAPSIVLLSTWAYVDLGLAFYTFAAFYALATWTQQRSSRWLLLAGILSGFALGVKYTAIVTPLVLGLLVVWESTKGELSGALRRLLLFGLSTAAIACPWYLKNWVLMGNPVYPFFFAGRYWDPFRAWWYSRWGTGLLNEPLRLLVAPWEMTIMGVEGKAGYEASIGPVLLASLPLLLLVLVWNRRTHESSSIVTWSAALCSAHYLLWLYGVAQSDLLRQTRLLFPIFPLLAILAGIAIERLSVLDVRGFSAQRFVLMALVIALCLNVVTFLVSIGADSPFQYLLGLETRDQFLTRHLGEYYTAVSHINDDLPQSAKVLFLWEPRSYYCQKECWPDAILDRFKHLTYRYGDAPGIDQHLRERGITHVLYHKTGFEQIVEAQFDPILRKDKEILRTLQEEHWEPMIHVAQSYVIYRVR